MRVTVQAQLQIFEMVKRGMNIEDALFQASRSSSSEAHAEAAPKQPEKRSSFFGGKSTDKKDKDKPPKTVRAAHVV